MAEATQPSLSSSSSSVHEKEKTPEVGDSSSSTATMTISDTNLLLATAIYEIGLRYASPKVIMSFMPKLDGLTNEHIKSHLQKYRIHAQRSKTEFQQFYEDYYYDYISAYGEAVDPDGHVKSEYGLRLAKRGLAEEALVDDCIAIVNEMDGEIKMTGQLIQQGVEQFDVSNSLKYARLYRANAT